MGTHDHVERGRAADAARQATAAYLVGEDEESIAAWSDAYHGYLGDDARADAARCAFWAGFQLANRGEMAQAGGWFARAQRAVDGLGPCAEVGYLLVPAGLQALGAGDPAAAHEHFTAAAELGRRFADVDLLTFGHLGCGQARIEQGDTEAGLRLLDEAMVTVMADEVAPAVAGIVYCAVIATCQLTFEVRRAQEWTDALTRWCERQPDLVPYRGQCLVHRAEILQMHGAWSDALDEVHRACDHLSRPVPQPALGAAHYQRAELHRLRGEFPEAAEAYAMASRYGRDPQPGLALLRLAEGDGDAAASAIRRVMAEVDEQHARARVLAAATEILLAAGDRPAASATAGELAEIAASVGAPYLDAMADFALGAAQLADGAPAEALTHLRRAAVAWNEIDVPLEGARTRVAIALACRALGDDDTATLELDVASRVFRDLGAAADIDRLRSLTTSGEPDRHGLTRRELEVLRLLSAGSTNKAIAGELGLSERTVERHLSNIFTKLGVSTRSGATAFAYEHQLV